MPSSANRSVSRIERYCVPPVAVIHQAGERRATAVIDRVLERIQDEVGAQDG